MANGLNPAELHRLARLGALARLQQLREEQAGLLSAFPELASSRGPAHTTAAAAAPAANGVAAAPSRKKYNMSSAERKAVSLRMKKYWAERRKQKAAAK